MAYHVICIDCGEPAGVDLSLADGPRVRKLRCSSDTCGQSKKRMTRRAWGQRNCQGHCARLEAAVPVTASKEHSDEQSNP